MALALLLQLKYVDSPVLSAREPMDEKELPLPVSLLSEAEEEAVSGEVAVDLACL